jgi:hypothetical protein
VLLSCSCQSCFDGVCCRISCWGCFDVDEICCCSLGACWSPLRLRRFRGVVGEVVVEVVGGFGFYKSGR